MKKIKILLLLMLFFTPVILLGQPDEHVCKLIEMYAKEYYIKKDINFVVSNWHLQTNSRKVKKKEKNDLYTSINSILNSEYRISAKEEPIYRYTKLTDTFYLFRINLLEVVNGNSKTLVLGINQRYVFVENTGNYLELFDESSFNKVVKLLGSHKTLEDVDYLSKLFFAFIKPGVGYCRKSEGLFESKSAENFYSVCKSDNGFLSKFKTVNCLSELQSKPDNIVHCLRFKEDGSYEYSTEFIER